MLHFHITLENPIRFKRPEFNLKWEKVYQVTNRKMLELSVSKFSDRLITLAFSIVTLDHAGFRLGVGLFGWQFDFDFYDTRHF